MNNTRIYKQHLLESLFYDNRLMECQRKADSILSVYYSHLNDIPMFSAAEMLEDIKEKRNYSLFVNSMNELQENFLYVSRVHGKSHIIRVSVLAFYLGCYLGLSDEQMNLCLEISKYHDVGRVNDNVDILHGHNGAVKISDICKNLNNYQKKLVMAVIDAHSIPDEICNYILYKEFLPNEMYQEFLLLVKIVKDADALDRFRLNDSSLNDKYLRCEFSKHMIRAACAMANYK